MVNKIDDNRLMPEFIGTATDLPIIAWIENIVSPVNSDMKNDVPCHCDGKVALSLCVLVTQ